MLLPEWRRSAAVWWCIPLIVFTVLYAHSQTLYGFVPGYADSTVASTTVGMVFAVPVVSAIAAWDMARLVRGKVFLPLWQRSKVNIVILALFPAVLLGISTIFAAFVGVALGGSPQITGRALTGLIPYVASVFAGVSIGALFGRYLSNWLASTLVLVGGYVWFAYPPALEPGWIRSLTGYQSMCCGASSQFIALTWVVPTLICVGIIVATVPWVFGKVYSLKFLMAGFSVAIVTAGFLGASYLAKPYGMYLSADRTDPLVCAQYSVEVCVWPENVVLLDSAQHDIDAAVNTLVKSGIDIPHTITESQENLGAWKFSLSEAMLVEGTLQQHIVQGLAPYSRTDECLIQAQDDADFWAVYSWLGQQIDPEYEVFEDVADHELFAMKKAKQVDFVQSRILYEMTCEKEGT
ncbi:DUF7224 domain-containing protein [Timonella sp. A28]|uniref:DUF7224 domain-containing protein n=1 Tax=Timonella sp. A28 TaxID=3442640 RepID=UPI003EC024AF